MDSQQAPGRDRILVLDSNADDLRITSESISSQIPASEVTQVQTAGEFRKAIHSEQFDVVVLDQNLGDADGLQLIQELKLQEYEPSVVVVSSSQEPMDVAAVYNMGCQRCIVKEDGWVEQLGATVRPKAKERAPKRNCLKTADQF